ncbi:hypothetical protein BDN71DRAFT_1431662 [Pleurotus eryngii]|uniref:Uncharacterized protein n=1 Tax=Pleurotus eryngii TaxID=5323 RepID=A0A9P5ZUK5_PLEER|nr:hypothetical protein BDN71DRAFT_1431662 [Pleurotus eryngii]
MSMPLSHEIASLSLQDEDLLNLINEPLEHDCKLSGFGTTAVIYAILLSDMVTKLYDWLSSILDKALQVMETERKKQMKGSTESILPGLYAKILSNIVITAMGLRYSMEGVELLEYWNEVTNIPGLNANEILEYKSQYITLSPLVPPMTKDLMGKSMSRHWHLLMWMLLGSAQPQQLADYEAIIWTAVHHIARRPSKVESSMRNTDDGTDKASDAGVDEHGDNHRLPGLGNKMDVDSPTIEPLGGQHSSGDGNSAPGPQQGASPEENMDKAPEGSLDEHGENNGTPGLGNSMDIDSPTVKPLGGQNSGGNSNSVPGPQQDASPEENTDKAPEGGLDEHSKNNRPSGLGNDMDVQGPAVEPLGGRNNGSDSLDENADSNNPNPSGSTGGENSCDNEEHDCHIAVKNHPTAKFEKGTLTCHQHWQWPQQENTLGTPKDFRKTSSGRTTCFRSSTIKSSSRRTALSGSSNSIAIHRNASTKLTPTPTHVDSTQPFVPVLVGTSKEPHFVAPVQTLYDIQGGVVELSPSFHHESHLKSVVALIDSIHRTYGDLAPPYTSGEAGSLIMSVSYKDYQEWASSGRLGDELNTRVILVMGVPTLPPKTFPNAVRDLSTSLNASLICHDLSTVMGPEGTECHWEATLVDLINISKSPDVKSLNFLDIPGPLPVDILLVHNDTLNRACYPLTWDVHQPRECVDMLSLQLGLWDIKFDSRDGLGMELFLD